MGNGGDMRSSRYQGEADTKKERLGLSLRLISTNFTCPEVR